MAGENRGPDWKFGALRTMLYDPGPWNGESPFLYDHTDPDGQGPLVRLLPHYLETRRGNCVSMPILFLILAERLGLDVSLVIGPLHMLVRYRDESGRLHNIETTSGGHPAREEWLREIFDIRDRALETGIYLRSLPRREAIAQMASTVVEHLFDRGRFEEAIQVGETILFYAPRDVHTMVTLGTACSHLLQIGFKDKYPTPDRAPREAQARALVLARRNEALFAEAEALGWADDTAETDAFVGGKTNLARG
jgi:regulator of sirC expression with transglutaminase-like and TPR domain